MKTEDIIAHLFCPIDDRMNSVPKHPQCELYPSEIVTLGALFTLKGGRFRHFYRWLKREYSHLFKRLPSRTRLQRLLSTRREWADRFLRAPTFFTVTDSYQSYDCGRIAPEASNRLVAKPACSGEVLRAES